MIKLEEKWKETDQERLCWEVKRFCNENGHTVPLMDYDSTSKYPEAILIVKVNTNSVFFYALFVHLKIKFRLLEYFDLSLEGYKDQTGLVLPKKAASFMIGI